MQTASGQSQPQTFHRIQRARFNKSRARFSGEDRALSPRPPPPSFPLKYKIISTDISPMQQCAFPKADFQGSGGGGGGGDEEVEGASCLETGSAHCPPPTKI